MTSNDDIKHINGFIGFQDINQNESQINLNCDSCQVLKRLVSVKDIAISRLNEDRDDLKLKLTQINNKNIELNQRLKRFESQKQEVDRSDTKNDNYIELKKKYEELEAVNRHLKQHLNTLRLVFNELHNSSESTSNETTTNVTINASNSSTNDSLKTVTKTEAKTDDKSTSTDLNSTIDKTTESTKIGSNLSEDSKVESLDETLISSFEKWYNK